jgi:tetratricopeptide (TPR) repeat protein
MLGFLKAFTKTASMDQSPHVTEAARYLESRNYVAAERELALAVAEAKEQEAAPTARVRLYIELARVQRLGALDGGLDRDRLETALRTVCEAIDLAAKASDTKNYVDCLDLQADILFDLELWPALEGVVQDAIRLSAALSRTGGQVAAHRAHRLAIAQAGAGRAEEAASSFDRAVKLHEEAYGPEAVETAGVLLEAGAFVRSQNADAEAVRYFKQALRIQESLYGVDSPQAGRTLDQLGACYESAGDLEGAARQYERALAMQLLQLGTSHLEQITQAQYGLAKRHIEWGNLTRARELLEECVARFQQPAGPEAAPALEELARVEFDSGRFQSAAEVLERAADAWERGGPGHTASLIRALELRAELLVRLNRAKDAGWLRDCIARLSAGAG